MMRKWNVLEKSNTKSRIQLHSEAFAEFMMQVCIKSNAKMDKEQPCLHVLVCSVCSSKLRSTMATASSVDLCSIYYMFNYQTKHFGKYNSECHYCLSVYNQLGDIKMLRYWKDCGFFEACWNPWYWYLSTIINQRPYLHLHHCLQNVLMQGNKYVGRW